MPLPAYNIGYEIKKLRDAIIDNINAAFVNIRFRTVVFDQVTFIGGIHAGVNLPDVLQEFNNVRALTHNGTEWMAMYEYKRGNASAYKYLELRDLPIETLHAILNKLEAQKPYIGYHLTKLPPVTTEVYRVLGQK